MNPVLSMPEVVRLILHFLFGHFTSRPSAPVKRETSRERRERNARHREIRALRGRHRHGRQTRRPKSGMHQRN